jgi:hypothetical protein
MPVSTDKGKETNQPGSKKKQNKGKKKKQGESSPQKTSSNPPGKGKQFIHVKYVMKIIGQRIVHSKLS